MKSIAAYQKYVKYLALPGLALVTAGLLAGHSGGVDSPAHWSAAWGHWPADSGAGL
jgi:hypothetical protein